MSYETLDAIADSYIPSLLIIFLLGLLIKLFKVWPVWKPIAALVLLFISLLSVAYGLMFLDNAFKIWPRLGWDYSTHTAISLVLVFCLCLLFEHQRVWVLSSFVAYVLLMLYQQYHTVADIFSTALVIAGCAFCLLAVKKRYCR